MLDEPYDEPLRRGFSMRRNPQRCRVRAVAEAELRDRDIVHGEAAGVGGVVGHVLEAEEKLAPGERRQVDTSAPTCALSPV
jgi:hypothetical protein